MGGDNNLVLVLLRSETLRTRGRISSTDIVASRHTTKDYLKTPLRMVSCGWTFNIQYSLLLMSRSETQKAGGVKKRIGVGMTRVTQARDRGRKIGLCSVSVVTARGW